MHYTKLNNDNDADFLTCLIELKTVGFNLLCCFNSNNDNNYHDFTRWFFSMPPAIFPGFVSVSQH